MNIVGVDVGGTNIRATLFDAEREACTVARPAVLAAGETPTSAMTALIGEVAGGRRLDAVGMAITGPVDVRSRIVANPHTLPDWSGSDWIDQVEAALGVPVVVDNDAMGAAFGEFRYGAGRTAEVMVMVTLGTGIGVAVVSRNAGALRGAGAFHPEGGHMLISDAGERCYCGQVGCWEELCSGTGIPKYWMTDGVIRWADYGRMLARGIRNVSRAYAPDMIVLGGGVSDSFELFAPALRESFAEPDPMGTPVVLARAELDEPGTAGAAYCAQAMVCRNESTTSEGLHQS